MGKGDYLKFKIKDIENKLSENKLKWIDGEYKNRDSKIIVETIEGYKAIILIGTFMNGAYPKIFFSKNPFAFENIKLWIKNNTDYKLISKEYKNAYAKLELKCTIHGNFKISWNKLYQGEGCSKCANNKKYTLEQIKYLVSTINDNIEIISEEYNGMNEYLTCKCKIDDYVWKTTPHNILSNNNGCPECKRKKFLGENNHNYNPYLTKEERELKRNYIGEDSYNSWRKSVYKRDNYTCQCCGNIKNGDFNAHHLNGWNWDKEHRVDVNNGITLCEECHKEFHNLYGYGNNTKYQFEEFLNNKNKSA